MKNFLLISLLILTCAHTVKSSEINWLGWEEGIALSKELNKPVIVFVHADWCHLCQRMENFVFPEETVAQMIQDSYIPVKLNVDDKNNFVYEEKSYRSMELVARITENKCQGIPATIFIPADPEKKNKISMGLLDPDEMKKQLKKNL